jgi:hypothetical protein
MQTEQTETDDESGLAGDRLVGVAEIGNFIDPAMSLWKVQRLLEAGVYPSTKEGRIYVASKVALRECWIEMTRQKRGGRD